MTEEELAKHNSKTLLQLLLSADARCDALTAQLESTLKDRKLILEERDRTFALMLARAQAAEAERDRLREDLEELDFLRHEGGPDSVAAIEAERDRLREALRVLERASTEVASCGARTGPQWLKLTVANLNARAALKGESHE